MRAIQVHQFGDPSVMLLEELPDPQPAPNQVLVAIRAVGVNPVDTYIRTGVYAFLPPLPYTPGSDAAGVVEAVGSEITRVAPGARVYISGTAAGRAFGAYASKAVCTVDQVHPLPEHVSFAEGAGLGVPYVTAWRALFDKARAVPGETVLIHGASGAVGIAAVQMARAAGLQVLGTAGTERGRQLVLAQGAHDVFDHAAEGYQQAIVERTGGRGVEVVIEMLANVNLAKDLDLIAKRGRIVVVGNRGSLEINPRAIMGKDAMVTGFTNWNALPGELAIAHAAIVGGLERSGYRPHVRVEMALRDAPQAHTAVLESGSYGKIVLIP